MRRRRSNTQKLSRLQQRSLTMRIYLDQMFRADLTELLRAEGHDVVRSEELGQQRADDAEILRTASAQERVLVTLDEHFGDWAVLPLNHHPGVIRLKVNPTTTENAAALLLPFLSQHQQKDFRNHLVIVSEKRTRWIDTAQN